VVAAPLFDVAFTEPQSFIHPTLKVDDNESQAIANKNKSTGLKKMVDDDSLVSLKC
jgi:uncharacterized protein (DUF2126 family)